MPQITLHSPEITCDHCIATISETVEAVSGARFVTGDPDRRQFVIEIDGGAVLDAVSSALAEAGYPIGDAPEETASSGDAADGAADADWRPEYRITATEAGADVNYTCPCSCEAGFALDRSRTEQDAEGCCCGRQIIVGAGAEARLRSALDGGTAYRIDVQELTMPWGQPLQAALAIPEDGGEHDGG